MITRVPCAVEHDAPRCLVPVRLLPTKELFIIIQMHMMNREIIPDRKKRV